jgi:hypothetical protein
MDAKDEGKAEKTFKSFGKRVDEFVVELNEAAEKLENEFREKYEDLKVSAEKLKKEAQDKERWKEVENSLRRAGDELRSAFHAAFKKKEPEEKQ